MWSTQSYVQTTTMRPSVQTETGDLSPDEPQLLTYDMTTGCRSLETRTADMVINRNGILQ